MLYHNEKTSNRKWYLKKDKIFLKKICKIKNCEYNNIMKYAKIYISKKFL